MYLVVAFVRTELFWYFFVQNLYCNDQQHGNKQLAFYAAFSAVNIVAEKH